MKLSKTFIAVTATLTLLSTTLLSIPNNASASSKNGWHYLSNKGTNKYRYSKSLNDVWIPGKVHSVIVKKDVPVYNVSTKNGVSNAGIIGKKTLKKGTIVKGYFPVSSPSGFNIESSNKFKINNKYEENNSAVWIVHPKEGLYSNYWMKAIK